MNTMIKRILIIIIIVVANIGLDQITKSMAVEQLQDKAATYYRWRFLKPWFELQ